MQIEFTAPLWQWQARTDSWWFVTVPPEHSDELADLPLPPRGFGSVRVRVTVGSTTWTTSVFPSDSADGYVLPMKKKVRQAEGLEPDEPVSVTLETLDV
ncbi:DUF1905 domain-containing protein [Promicromonospora thailandica]|uniref:DUF1905 domain-containing protein n=1 Tax=Promicromonospora thailandica TaxID=765201 RepID=A0A9X2JUX7_9MICO|nr:DUF1905 domain-containing protein [Promicromonospora thailandica]MCP2264975.1 protein of unknown function (DUF1905) [Promicromonospora thailandica]BFF18745.1 DUF1905 domain-containing protein [Promicromonospora thailandica]